MIRATLDHYPSGSRSARSRCAALRGSPVTCADELHLAVDTVVQPLRRRRGGAGDRGLPGVGRLGRGRGVVAAVRPRPAAPGLALRCRRRGPGAGPGDGPGAAWRCPVRRTSTTATSWGCPNADLPDEARRDAVWHHGEDGRDGCRVPQPWEEDLPAYGFTTGEPWLPIPDSTPRCTRPPSSRTPARPCRCTGARWSCAACTRVHRIGRAGPSARVVRRPTRLPGVPARARPWCAHSTPPPPRSRCPPGDPLLVSGPLDDGMLPPDTAVWLA